MFRRYYSIFEKKMQVPIVIGCCLLTLMHMTILFTGRKSIEPTKMPEPMEMIAEVKEEKPAAKEVRYSLDPEQRDIVERVVMAEAGAEDYDGMRLVAQCILNACEIDGISPDEAIEKYQYTKPAESASEACRGAVRAVFDDGDVVTQERILFFYAPAICYSEWHESQVFVLEHGGHRFFKLKGE